MFNEEEFIANFIEAVKNNDNVKIRELSDSVKDATSADRLKYMDKIVAGLKEEEGVDEETVNALSQLTEALRLNVKNSTSEEAKDNTEAKEVTQDVAADTGAEATEAEEGEAPAEEEKAEKSEDKA